MIRRILIAIGFLALLALIAQPIWNARDQWHFGQSYDDGIYWVSAKSLASGNGYRIESLPGQPFAVKYPPIYPLFLSLAWRWNPGFPANLATGAILQALLVPVYLALALLSFRQLGFSWRRTFLLGALTVTTFYFVLAAITLLSDLLFCCFLLASILALERASMEYGRSGWRWAALGGALAGATYLTRVAALPLLIAIPVFFWLRKRNALTFISLAIAFPAVAGWTIWTHSHAAYDPSNLTYVQEYSRVIGAGGLWANFLKQIALISGSVAETFYSGILQWLSGIPLHHLILIGAVIGAVRMGRRKNWPLYAIFSGFYLTMLAMWWFTGLTRLLLPVWPLLLAGIAEEASHFASLCEQTIAKSKGIAARIPKQAVRWGLVALGYLIVVHNDRASWARVSAIVAEEKTSHSNDLAAFDWIGHHASDDTVVLAWKDGAVYLYSGVAASHPLFLSLTPGNGELRPLSASLATLPSKYRRALLLRLASDLPEDERSDQASALDVPLNVSGSKLEFRGPGARIYSLPPIR